MWAAGELRSFWVALAFAADGDQAVRAVARRYQIPIAAVDDLRQEWVLSLDRTLTRHPELVEQLDTEDVARRYAFRTLRNRALDWLRGARSRAEILADVDDSGASIIDRTPAPGDVDITAMAEATLGELRQRISERLTTGAIVCGGCRAPVVAQIALAVVDAYFGRGALGEDAARLAGGTTELDELIYEGLKTAAPELVTFDDHGRASARTRQSKSRCGRCTRDLLADVLARHTGASHGAEADDNPSTTPPGAPPR